MASTIKHRTWALTMPAMGASGSGIPLAGFAVHHRLVGNRGIRAQARFETGRIGRFQTIVLLEPVGEAAAFIIGPAVTGCPYWTNPISGQ